jgi:TonB family protein
MALASSPVSYGAVAPRGVGANGVSALAGDGGGETATPSTVSVPARALVSSAPEYPADARRSGIEADLLLELLIDTRGVVIDARSLRTAGYGLDEAAVAAARRWRFAPAQKDGHLVRVRMTWPVSFRLQ